MRAQILENITNLEKNPSPLKLVEIPIPMVSDNKILVKISACGICHTELDEIEGRLIPKKFPIILGHQIIGKVEKLGPLAQKFRVGDRVGIAWIYSSCGRCKFCIKGQENLCEEFKATGYDADGGYAEYTVVREDFSYKIPERFSDKEGAPLLCAGVIGYRALRLTGIEDGSVIGLFGFGASAHIVIQIIKYKYPNTLVFVFTRPFQNKHQELAKRLGADWVGASGDEPPKKLNYAIDFTPAWNPIVQCMRALDRCGRLVINTIRKEEYDKESLLKFDYASDLWQEKEIKSVANVTRKDVEEFLQVASRIPIRPEIEGFKLEDANKALNLLKKGSIHGGGVLIL